MTAGHPRVNCCIPGCRRGTTRLSPGWDPDTGGDVEWICGPHWRLVPRSWKRRRSLYWRRLRKHWPDGATWEELSPVQRVQVQTLYRLMPKMWARMKRHAESPLSSVAEEASLADVERAFGIA